MTTQVTDTIIANKRVIEEICNDPVYDYDSQLNGESTSWVSDIIDFIKDYIDRTLLYPIENLPGGMRYLIAIGVALCVLALMYNQRAKIMSYLRRNEKVDFVAVEDDINAIDFDVAIADALKKNNYREACRYIYLKTLKALSDSDAIDWKIFKTPLQYTHEVRDREFREITNHFLRVRYGDYDATRGLYDTMLSLHNVIVEKYAAVASDMVEENQEEGGEQS